jgi:hypothetical protein
MQACRYVSRVYGTCEHSTGKAWRRKRANATRVKGKERKGYLAPAWLAHIGAGKRTERSVARARYVRIWIVLFISFVNKKSL